MLPATSGGDVHTPSFTAKEAPTDSNHHLYQPEKIETEGNPIKYMACSFLKKCHARKSEGKKCIAQKKFFLNVMANKDQKAEELLWVTGTEVRDNKHNTQAKVAQA